MTASTLLRRAVAWPSDHGSWVFLLSPLLVGLVAGGRWRLETLYLVVAALAGFLVRQPLTTAVKVWAGRRPHGELPAALLWSAVYAAVGGATLAGLVLRGFGYLLYLALPGVLVFTWYLLLVWRRDERRQVAMELLATGVLALAAPAALWVGLGRPAALGWLLWALLWAQSVSSVLWVHYRLAGRRRAGGGPEPLGARLARGGPALAASWGALLAVALLAASGARPAALVLPFLVQAGESLWGVLRPPAPVPPTAVGLRQLAASALFTLLFCLTWPAGGN